MLAAGFALEITTPGVLLAAMAAGLAVTAGYAVCSRGLRHIEPHQLLSRPEENR